MTSKYESLAAKHPDFFVFPECGEGWHDIISEVCRIAETRIKNRDIAEFKFTQIKEKFGGLRMYFDGGDDYIAGAVRMAESVSFRTCEITGKPGVLCKKGGWLRTLCDEQAELNGFTPLKGD
jgi:hypothetical protein